MMKIPDIDYSLCTGCGGCADAFPELFVIRDDKAWFMDTGKYDPVLHQGVLTVCPYYAISIIEV